MTLGVKRICQLGSESVCLKQINRLILCFLWTVATGVYQNSTFGLAAILPMKYTNAIVLGTVSGYVHG